MGQITHPTLGSPMAMVTPYAELVVTGSRSIDKSTYANIYINHEHHEIHDGTHFNYRSFASGQGIGSNLIFCVETPNSDTWIHMSFGVDGTTQTEVRGWEGPTLSGGTTVSYFNNNRNSTYTGSLIIKQGCVVSGASPTSGLLIEKHSKGFEAANPSAADNAGIVSRDDEWILKSGTTYMWEIKSLGVNNIINYSATWYEHKDKVKQW